MVLVTGATGFLGSEVCRQLILAGKNSIRCTKRASSVVPEILLPFQSKIDWVEADLLEIDTLNEALQGVTQVYHCAALVSFDPSLKKKLIQNNVEGTANLVNLCMEKGIRLLHVSSIAAVGEGKPGELINENHHLEETPKDNAYAISKYESEMEVWRGMAEGLDAVIVNPSLIIGKNAGTAGTGQIFETVRQGLKFYTSGSCGLVDVEDVAKTMILLMESKISNERFIINAENWSYKSLFEETTHYFGIKPPAFEAKPWMLELAWRASALGTLFTGKKMGVDKISAQSASRIQDYDNCKVKEAIGFEFKPVKETLKAICEVLKG
ncbi:NAD-dependent epimerase/dehydratase family protein [uncultured Mucilaginibacter sp.]|uniref:NAD-dependent epimerase/dehydratase family protein n=1 Tax=uncultured Mucilaginibacter sp. TaxID=797541 RepID=UPI0026300153|nr:NAD-dependent epimerase/dehydratase family protein [uncultured Mucilaginibacter sp.]